MTSSFDLKAFDKAMPVALWLLALLCALPVLAILSGMFWQDGQLSLSGLLASFSDGGRLLTLLGNSLLVAGGTLAVALLLGIPTGFLCFRTDLPARRVVIIGCLIGACIPLYVTATSWMALFGMHFWLYRTWGACWIQGIAYVPLVALISGIGFGAADRELEEVAAVDTDNRGVFWHATLPQGSWGMIVSALAVVVLTLTDITVTDILMVRTFAEETLTAFQLGATAPEAAALSLPLAVVLLALAVAAWRHCRTHGQGTVTGSASPPPVMPLGRYRPACALFVGLVVLCFFLLPLGALVRAVGNWRNLLTAYRVSQAELLGTLRLSSVAATLCVLVAVAAAWAIIRMKRCRWPVMALVLLLLAVPGPVVGIGLIELFNREGLPGMIYDSQAIVILAYMIRTLPFGILAMLPAMKRIPVELEELSVIEGANWSLRMREVILPLTWRAMIVAWFLVFALSISELGASFLVVPPGRTTLTVRFFTLIHYGVYPDAAGICIILLLLVAVCAAVIAAVLWGVLKTRFIRAGGSCA